MFTPETFTPETFCVVHEIVTACPGIVFSTDAVNVLTGAGIMWLANVGAGAGRMKMTSKKNRRMLFIV